MGVEEVQLPSTPPLADEAVFTASEDRKQGSELTDVSDQLRQCQSDGDALLASTTYSQMHGLLLK